MSVHDDLGTDDGKGSIRMSPVEQHLDAVRLAVLGALYGGASLEQIEAQVRFAHTLHLQDQHDQPNQHAVHTRRT